MLGMNYSIIMVVTMFLFVDWYARCVFVAIVYPRRYGHGKSFNRAKNHYKSNWSFKQRLVWQPIFREPYKRIYRITAYLSYIHALSVLLAIVTLLANEYCFKKTALESVVLSTECVLFLIRYIHENHIALYERRGHK